MLNNEQKQQMQGIAALGRNEDVYLAHVAPDEMIVPAQALRDNPLLKVAIEKSISKYGIDPNQFLVGHNDMDLNPLTGLPEFGFLSKLWKGVKKVVKVIAPVASIVPGPWQPFAAVYNKGNALNNIAKGNASIGDILALGAGGTQSVFGKGGALANISAGTGIMNPSAWGTALGNIGQVGGKFDPFGYIKNLGSTASSNLKQGFGGIFQGNQQVVVKSGDTVGKIATANGTTVAEMIKANPALAASKGNFISIGQTLNIPGSGILSNVGQGVSNLFNAPGGGTPSLIKSAGDAIGLGGPSGLRDFYGTGTGTGTDSGSGLFGNFPGGIAGLAGMGLLGKAVYDDFKRREGGMAETPLVTMDQLGRYNLSKELGTGGTRGQFGLGPAPKVLDFDAMAQTVVPEEQPRVPVYMGGPINRQYFNQGGLAAVELDMRDGGESEGFGTGTSDDVPAMLSDGEFVMTAAATKGAGAFNVNKTKSGIELISDGKASRDKGVENLRELMNIFEAV
tara:strand:+ start:2935 stop:4455 length:1521 start_codon:yes stop_codon:yes gene_type:complete